MSRETHTVVKARERGLPALWVCGVACIQGVWEPLIDASTENQRLFLARSVMAVISDGWPRRTGRPCQTPVPVLTYSGMPST